MILALITAALAYSGAVWVVFWLRPLSPAGLYLVRAGYLNNLAVPHNVPGLNAMAAVARLARPEGGGRWFSSAKGLGHLRGPVDLGPDAFQGKDLLELPESTLILYLTAQGGADEEKGAFLFKDDPVTPGGGVHSAGKIYLSDVIAQLKGQKSKRFCLILDVTLATANAPMGMIHNDFVRKLIALDSQIAEAKNLVVIAPASISQKTWASDGWRETVFGHFVAEGLQRRGPGGSSRVDSRALFEDVREKVATWTRAHRGEEQTPILLPAVEPAPNLDLARASSAIDRSPEEPEITPIPKPWESRWRARWLAYRSLKASTPEAHAPALWRNYRDLLVRYEELIRSIHPPETSDAQSFPEILSKVEKDLDVIAERIEAARRIVLGHSSENSLAMKAAQGGRPTSLDDSKIDFGLLWDPKTADKVANVDKKRLEFSELLLRRLEPASGPEDYDRARVLLGNLRDPQHLPPIEAHFLTILLRDMPEGASRSADYRELVGLALRVRRQSERAALGLGRDDPESAAKVAFSEQIAPLVEGRVAIADRNRRRAEDLLFVDDPASWEVARTILVEVEASFAQAQAQASTFRDALASRNRACADLPYYGSWAAHRPSSGGASAESLVDDIVGAWKKARDLTKILSLVGKKGESRPTIGGNPVTLALPDLGPIEAQFAEECRHWQQSEPRPDAYASILAMLDTPFLDDVDQRKALLEKLNVVAKSSLNSSPTTSGPTQSDAEAAEAILRKTILAGRRQGRLAMAALEQPRLDESEVASVLATSTTSATPSGSKTEGRFEPFEVFQRLRDLLDIEKMPPNAEALDRLAHVGNRVGRAYRQIPETLDRLLKQRREPILDQPESLEEADHLGRLLVSGQLAIPEGPTLAYRNRLLQRLMLGLGRRALVDHWYSEDDQPDLPAEGSPKPYFRASAEAFLHDLEAFSRDWAEDSGYLRLKRDLAEATRLGLQTPLSPLVVTDEPAIDLGYRIEAPAGMPGLDGRSTVWLTIDGGSPVRFTSPRGMGRRVVAIDKPGGLPAGRLGPPDGRFEWQVDFSTVEKATGGPNSARRPNVARGSLRLEGRYRGQILRDRTVFNVHPVPEIVVAEAPPRATGDVVVQAEPELIRKFGANEGGALAIVLDCSRSMGPAIGQPDDGPSKYKEATQALATILGRVTRGTMVSLWVFGPAVGSERTAEPNRTIFRIQEPTSWRPDDPAQLAGLMARIESPALLPWNKSPIVRTMIAAGEDLRNVSGFKTMIVLTDGKDTGLETEVTAPNRPRPEIAVELRRAFAASDVEINIVGYKLADAEDEVRKQFRVIEEFRRPGTFYPVRQAGALADALASALRPLLRYSVQDTGNIRLNGEIELGAVPDASAGFKGLPPGGYKLVVEAASRFEREMTINRGDHLVVRLAERRGQIEMNRVVWTDDSALDVTSRTIGDWRFSVLRSQKRGDGLSIRTSLEKLLLSKETAMELIRPRSVWFELKAEGVEGATFQQRSTRIDVYPAPSWELTVPDWPARPQMARPRLSAWWDPDQEEEPIATLPRADFRSIEEARDRVVPIDGGQVMIESVALEDLAGDDPSAVGRRPAKRLVVRASFPREERFWIKLRGLRTESAEHRFYTEAGKYTGLFWPVTEDQLQTSLKGLGLISVKRFREQAERRGHFIADLDARSPTPSDVGPDEVSTATLQGPTP